MSIRFKLLIVFFGLGVAPMLLLSIVNYLNGLRTVENLLRGDVERSVGRIVRHVEESLSNHESNLIDLAHARSLRDFIRQMNEHPTLTKDGEKDVEATASHGSADVPNDVRSDVGAFFRRHRNYYAAITCLSAKGQPLFRIERLMMSAPGQEAARFQTQDILMSEVRTDGRVWSVAEMSALRSPVTRESFGACVHYTVPIFIEDGTNGPRGALVVDLKLSALFEAAERDDVTPGSPIAHRIAPDETSRFVLALDHEGAIIYDTNVAHNYRPVAEAMPFFKPIADQMLRGASGFGFYNATDGDRWLAAYQPLSHLDLSVAVAGNYTSTVRDLQRAGLIGIAFSLLIALVAAALLTLIVRRTARRIERVSAGAAAIAGGKLDQRIEVHTNDETRVLAESFNRMTDRLREHIAREAETRQFQSFMRLSAMLTHDLKNAITGLSMLVNNMERQFHREEFRADAISSLRDATDKLRAIVARLSEPMRSLSGERRINARPVDLVPIIKSVLAETAQRSASFYEVETHLPESLVVTVEAERIKSVIENLIINAMEAMGAKGGRLTIEAGHHNADQIFFSVADTGVGMSEEFIRTRLFRAFATTKNKGIGLGLYTCREIVEVHGGRFEVESEVGVGTRFRVVLPSNTLSIREGKKPPSQVAAIK